MKKFGDSKNLKFNFRIAKAMRDSETYNRSATIGTAENRKIGGIPSYIISILFLARGTIRMGSGNAGWVLKRCVQMVQAMFPVRWREV